MCPRTAATCPIRIALVIAAFVATAYGGSVASAASTGPTVKVWFIQGEQMVSLERPGATVQDALNQLLAGPTAAERQQGIRTYIPVGATLVDVSVVGQTATVIMGQGFAGGSDTAGQHARLSQVVYSATGPQGVEKVRVEIRGKPKFGAMPDASTAVPLTVKTISTPNLPVPKSPALHPSPVDPKVLQEQKRLVDLGYMLPAEADGEDGPVTHNAVLAFQKWEGLTRDGQAGPQTLARLQTAVRPTPVRHGGNGRRIEVLLDRQVALAIDNDLVVRVIHVSTGAPATPTPPGDYTVYAKFTKWWSVPFREWLLWAVPFRAGIAIHQFPEVPTTAASHGCVRNTFATSKWIFEFASVGTPVEVIATSA